MKSVFDPVINPSILDEYTVYKSLSPYKLAAFIREIKA